jgi:hypothetical protein
VTASTLECEPSRQEIGRDDLRKWSEVIRSEYLALPGLSLTAPQVQRLWNLNHDTCECLLDAMVRTRFLRQTADAQYVRTDWC